MKCPKCGYLGFDRVDRCRNCGYDFSLARDVAAVPELPLRGDSEPDTFADLALSGPRNDPSAADLDDLDSALAGFSGLEPGDRLDPPSWEPAASRTAPAARESVALGDAGNDLPLFGGRIADDVPLITRPSPPRQPLAVRRATPEVPRLRAESPRTQLLDLSLDPDMSSTLGRTVAPSVRAKGTAWPEVLPEPSDDAAIGARIAASLIDLGTLMIVDAAVLYFTMQICGITIADLDILPKAPLLAFFLVQNGGYLVAFTAGGQTIGKMAAGIRVVTAGSGSSLDIGRALLRTLMWVVLAIPAGLGFLSAVFSSDHRGLHDRFAGTRVVRASA